VNPAPKRLRLGRTSRLAQSRDFARVRQQGQRLVLGCLIANWQPLPAGSTPKLGVLENRVTTSKAAPPWNFGISDLMKNLVRRGLLNA